MGCSLQEGTPVWHSTRGLGRIVSVTAGVVTPVVVRFSSGEARALRTASADYRPAGQRAGCARGAGEGRRGSCGYQI